MEREPVSHFLRRRNAEVVETEAVTGNARQKPSLDEAAVAAAMPRLTVGLRIRSSPDGGLQSGLTDRPSGLSSRTSAMCPPPVSVVSRRLPLPSVYAARPRQVVR